MKNVYKYYLLSLVLLSDFVVFAQPGDGDGGSGGGGGLDGTDPAPSPINSKLIVLAIMGILFAMYTYRKNKKTA